MKNVTFVFIPQLFNTTTKKQLAKNIHLKSENIRYTLIHKKNHVIFHDTRTNCDFIPEIFGVYRVSFTLVLLFPETGNRLLNFLILFLIRVTPTLLSEHFSAS